MTHTRPVAMLALLGLAAASWWLAGSGRDGHERADQPLAAAPGYYLVDATVEQTDASGYRTLSAHAERAVQSDPKGAVTLLHPTLHYQPQSGRDWVMIADAGTLPSHSQQVLLDGKVELRAAGRGAASAAIVRTEHLALDVGTHVATTADPVRIELAPHALLAHGLRADLTRETLRLESAVHGTFAR
ncbi:MAG: LPS export ABC transporter periplasmic protein LptC [Proteobacteria bacterium]|nr:LPS export ABC transporter periplasmic protein LptC [Pseudomonadota bacterium]